MKLRDLLKGTPAHAPFVPSPGDRVCTATTAKGRRCKLPADHGNDKCVFHKAGM